ncbi:hypothetical protein Droror1_Dr00006965 [Drosera rotundifolia]
MMPRSAKLAHRALLRGGKSGQRYLSKIADKAVNGKPAAHAITSQGSSGSHSDSSDWVPHPRTGIYFPKGQEWVMEDIPHSAGFPGTVCWFRSIDGVDKPDPDVPSEHYVQSTL